jgi:hypothetical protein
MAFKVNQNKACRAFDVELDDIRAYRHMNLLIEFSRRGVFSPRSGMSGPNFVGGKREGTHHVFFLAEEVADEYVRRMKPRTTKAEAEAARKFGGD